MNAATFIDDIALYHEGVDTTDGESPVLEGRILRNLQRIVNIVSGHRDWSYLWESSTISVTVGVTPTLPANFATFGRRGGLWVQDTRQPILPARNLQEIKQLIHQEARSGDPEIYATADISAAGLRDLLLYPTPNRALTLPIFYKRKPPTIANSTSPSGIEEIPDQYHEGLLKEGVVWLQMSDKGDLRASEQRGLFYEALGQMVINEPHGQEGIQNFEEYGAGQCPI